jgi:polyisoprenoid-binding protein YceI
VGDLTIHGVTKTVTLDGEVEGHTTDPWGLDRVAFSAKTKINRKDFGLTWNQALETGGIVVGEDLDISLEVQAVAK